MPAVLNAANEAAVARFLEGGLSFPGIWKVVEEVMSRHTPEPLDGALGKALEADAWARAEAERAIARVR